ncbi:MAG: exo-alpha-sialidase [Crenarchaeota archaeon]|nr:MAG: exo-alpha-sialidase [Thermoproteota archaeon]RDJ33991.1 MAG: exo-alpha-sialidase [Thermoproteota archaeon]RDJ36894.1 MAG: exo-alpha-sialidase [Thermoproteota archaeon]RDJ37570.1 MAG: exo-alpha-sialidase [Thermoproteota archaeon]
MKKKSLNKKNNTKTFLLSVIFVVLVVASITAVLGLVIVEQSKSTDSSTVNDEKTVNWRHVHGIGLDPVDPDILYIAAHGDFYQSLNGNLPVKVDEKRSDYMAFNAPPSPGIPLYASGHPSTGGNTGLIKSNNGGKTWEFVSNVIEPPADFHAMAISKQDPNVLIGFDSGARGLFKTTDAGITWNSLEYPEYISALAISPNDSDSIFAGTGNGIYKSSDGGSTWKHLNYKGITVYAIVFDDEGHLFASVDMYGLVHSDDQGEVWNDMQDINLTVTSMAADSQKKMLYVGGYSPEGFQEVFKIPYDVSFYEIIGTNKGLK